VMIILNNTQTINIADLLFEFIGLQVPMKKLHPRFQEEEEEEDDDARGEQPKTPHYPTRDEEENELKHTSSDDRTERNDSDDNDASLPLNENSKSIGGDAKDSQEEEVRNTASKVAI